MEKLLNILSSMHPDVSFAPSTDLIEGEILDSLDIVTLITEIGNAFDVNIPAEEITPGNFATPETIYALICRIDEE